VKLSRVNWCKRKTVKTDWSRALHISFYAALSNTSGDFIWVSIATLYTGMYYITTMQNQKSRSLGSLWSSRWRYLKKCFHIIPRKTLQRLCMCRNVDSIPETSSSVSKTILQWFWPCCTVTIASEDTQEVFLCRSISILQVWP
jgi:hypothetical protein